MARILRSLCLLLMPSWRLSQVHNRLSKTRCSWTRTQYKLLRQGRSQVKPLRRGPVSTTPRFHDEQINCSWVGRIGTNPSHSLPLLLHGILWPLSSFRNLRKRGQADSIINSRISRQHRVARMRSTLQTSCVNSLRYSSLFLSFNVFSKVYCLPLYRRIRLDRRKRSGSFSRADASRPAFVFYIMGSF